MILKKILIVDDSRTARLMIIQHLMKHGMDRSLFIEAENGLTAADLIRKDKFDLIITDILMPKMDGNTFIRKTRTLPINLETPIIVLSSMGEKGMEPETLKQENMYLLQKPIIESDLMKVLGEING